MTTTPIGRIVEIAGEGRRLAKHRGFMTVGVDGDEIGRIAIDDVSAVIVTSHATTITTNLVGDLAERGVPLVLCGSNFAPAAIVWPISGHHAQQRRMAAQIAAAKPLTKRLWANVVSAKIQRQAWALATFGQPNARLLHLAGKVRSGDPENMEAQAARLYWPLMMGADFRRDTDAPGINALLNYGYAVLRSATARAIVAAGLHPGIGIFHHHPVNAMPLADDLMEPFRPMVDFEVRNLLQEGPPEVTPTAKRRLVEVLAAGQATAAGTTPLSTVIIRFAASLAASFMAGKPALELPPISLAPPRDSRDGLAVADQ